MKTIHFSGKRKRAVARATMKEGKGIIHINNEVLDVYQPEMCKLRIQEPLLLAGDISKKVNINISVRGGGQVSQALVQLNNNLKKTFLDYDRNLLIADTRRKEPYKPNDSKARAKRQASKR